MTGSRMQEPPQAGPSDAEAKPDLRAIARAAAAMQAAESSAAEQQQAAATAAGSTASRIDTAAGDGGAGGRDDHPAIEQPSTRVDSLSPPETPVVANAKLQVRLLTPDLHN